MSEEIQNINITKTCKICKQEKPSSEYRKNSKTKDGLKNECRECDSKRAQEYYLANKKKIIKRIILKRHEKLKEKSP